MTDRQDEQAAVESLVESCRYDGHFRRLSGDDRDLDYLLVCFWSNRGAKGRTYFLTGTYIPNLVVPQLESFGLVIQILKPDLAQLFESAAVELQLMVGPNSGRPLPIHCRS
jgi:hypothetical protein